jgi:hypothetical protein
LVSNEGVDEGACIDQIITARIVPIVKDEAAMNKNLF